MDARASLLALFGCCVLLGLARSDLSLPIAGGEPVRHLSFWNGFTGPDGRTMLRMIRDFNDGHPSIEVTMQRIEWATYYNKLIVACLDGRGPDVFVIHASTLARMERAGFISPADDFFDEQSGPPLADFDPNLIEQLRYGGGLLGLPLDIHPQGLYGNAEMLRKVGYVDEEGNARLPADRDEFLDLAARVKQDLNPGEQTEFWGFAYTFWRMNLMTLMPQFGGRYLDEEGRSDLDNPRNVEALEFLGDLLHEHRLVPTPDGGFVGGGWVGFRQRKVAMVFDGVYMLGDLKRIPDLEIVAAPIPRIGPNPGTLADSHVLCVQAGLDPDRRAAAVEFIRHLSDHSLQWADAGQVPARRSVRETEQFRNLEVQYAFSKQVPYVMFPPKSPVLFEIQLELDLAVEKVFKGRATAKEALETAARNVQTSMDRDARQSATREAL